MEFWFAAESSFATATAPPAEPYLELLLDEQLIHGRLLLSGFLEVVNRPDGKKRDIADWAVLGWTSSSLRRCLADRPARGKRCFRRDWWIARRQTSCCFQAGSYSRLIRSGSQPGRSPCRLSCFEGCSVFSSRFIASRLPPDIPQRGIALVCQRVMLQWDLPVTSQSLEDLIRQECSFQESVGGIRTSPKHTWAPRYKCRRSDTRQLQRHRYDDFSIGGVL